MATTLEQPRPQEAPLRVRRGSSWWIVALVTVLGLVAGFAAGYWARGDSQGETTVIASSQQPELSERQLEMLQVLEEYQAALISGDGDAAEALVVPDFVMSYPTQGVTFTLDENPFQSHVIGRPMADMEISSPVFVGDETLVSGGYTDGGTLGVSIVQFTTSGDVLVTRHTLA